jgi:hypothetical protein
MCHPGPLPGMEGTPLQTPGSAKFAIDLQKVFDKSRLLSYPKFKKTLYVRVN